MKTFASICGAASSFQFTIFGRAHDPRRHSWRQVQAWCLSRCRRSPRLAA
jgi:hypothetical protein